MQKPWLDIGIWVQVRVWYPQKRYWTATRIVPAVSFAEIMGVFEHVKWGEEAKNTLSRRVYAKGNL